MKENFQHLLALQRLDTELKTLSDRLAGLPVRARELKKTAAELKSGLEAARKDITEHRKNYKLAEVELKTAEEKAAAYSVQLYSAKTNEQYKAFLKEIEAQRRLSSQIEDRMIKLMEEIEALETRVRQAESQAAEVDADVSAKIKLINDEQMTIESAIAEREAQRRTILCSVPPELLKRYDRIRANKAGLAVVTTERGRCGGCLSPIPPQRLLEVGSQDRLYLCEACGRILVPEQ